MAMRRTNSCGRAVEKERRRDQSRTKIKMHTVTVPVLAAW
jgi:hypothetical protein